MELIAKQSKNIMDQELIVKMSVADLVILDAVLGNQSEDKLFEALHYASTGCQSTEWHIYNGDHGVFKHMESNPNSHYENLYPNINKLMKQVFNIEE